MPSGGRDRARFDACQAGVAGDQAIERCACGGGRLGERVAPAVMRNQPVRVTGAVQW